MGFVAPIGLSMAEKVPRIRGRARQKMRARLLAANPICYVCGTAVAVELDHKVALTNGGSNDDENLGGICTQCHEAKTLKDLGQKPRVTIGIDGWPTEDAPRGPRWRRAG